MGSRLLLAHAALIEGAVLGEKREDVVAIGTGKAASTMNLTLAIERVRPICVLNFGVCGAYPADHGAGERALAVGDLCIVIEDRFGDEGALDEDGFHDLGAMGLGHTGPYTADPHLSRTAAEHLDVPRVRGATVSTCSAVDELSRTMARRTGALVETMEGAAVGMVCRQFGIPWVQLRCVSNRTGNRREAGWDLGAAADRVQAAVVRLLETTWPARDEGAPNCD